MPDIKKFNVRIPKQVWEFLKIRSMKQERSMNSIITDCLTNYKNRCENKLTSKDEVIL
jgi:predicted HicB family RNase H-like nuclease